MTPCHIQCPDGRRPQFPTYAAAVTYRRDVLQMAAVVAPIVGVPG